MAQSGSRNQTVCVTKRRSRLATLPTTNAKKYIDSHITTPLSRESTANVIDETIF